MRPQRKSLKWPMRPSARPKSRRLGSIKRRGNSKRSSKARIGPRSSGCNLRLPSWPTKSIAPPKTVTTSAASSGRVAGSPRARAWSSGGGSRATRNSASWRGWSGDSSRTRALNRKTLERGVAEAYDIELGAEIGRLIPAELLAMHHPVLRRDFHRRILEGSVMQYRLRDDEQKGKGPMVVCIDVSSSMEGEKEMWSKAVALTLMDIARRQRRLFRAVMFSSGDVSLKVLDLNRERRYQPDLNKVVEMAEYFPGGGTDFETPID